MDAHIMPDACWFSILVKGQNGRTWYRADSASTTDIDYLLTEVDRLRRIYPTLSFMVGLSNGDYSPAPKKYTPWVSE